MSKKFVWADVTTLISDIRAIIALRESLPIKYRSHGDMYNEMTDEINTQSDTVAHMIKTIASQPEDVKEDDIPF